MQALAIKKAHLDAKIMKITSTGIDEGGSINGELINLSVLDMAEAQVWGFEYGLSDLVALVLVLALSSFLFCSSLPFVFFSFFSRSPLSPFSVYSCNLHLTSSINQSINLSFNQSIN